MTAKPLVSPIATTAEVERPLQRWQTVQAFTMTVILGVGTALALYFLYRIVADLYDPTLPRVACAVTGALVVVMGVAALVFGYALDREPTGKRKH